MKRTPPFVLILLLFVFLLSCSHKKTLFNKLSSSYTGIHFNNKIDENDSLNPIDVTNIYNGGGVGIGDFNNDGLQDVYFTGNLVSNKLYLNKGKMKFDDITKDAGVDGKGRWCRGVSVVDINNDGWLDLYVCVSMDKDPQRRQNLLYINQGADKNGVPHFKEMAAEYGLNDTTHSTMAAFFDYDNDGDLDMYLVVNQILPTDLPSVFRPKITNGSHPSTGSLYRNDWNAKLGHPVFTDVSKHAGVTIEGYGHSVSIADFNRDGWKDIFVTNDFNSNDLLYINNHDGTFTDKSKEYFKHTSANGMGQDVIDINNDGLSDVVELDMNPEDNYRKKMMMGSNNYQTYQLSDAYGYQYQYVRNSIQLNQGPRVGVRDSIGDPIFSDIGYFSGIAETDWSWTPLVQDFDNDGYRDVIITNGFPRDITDHDFVAFRKESSSVAPKGFLLDQIPRVKIHNYGFHNNGNLTFSNNTVQWGLDVPSFSNGAVYADLDNDGDLDVIVNNINDEAFVYQNNQRNEGDTANHFIAFQLQGDSLNRNGIGCWVNIFYNGKQQSYEVSPYRGYLSTVQLNPQFGLGAVSTLDSVIVIWPDQKKQVLTNIKADQLVKLNIRNAIASVPISLPVTDKTALLDDITDSLGVHFKHEQKDFIDFTIQRLLPHKFSEYGPAMAVGDVDGNGLDDIVVGGSYASLPVILLQQQNGSFKQKTIPVDTTSKIHWYDMGITLFDANNDGHEDLIITRGGYESAPGSPAYTDYFYVNDGKGNFKADTTILPINRTSKSCIRIADYDNDGLPDIFIAGRVEPWNYPAPVSSFIYHNDSKNGKIHFTDVTNSIAPSLNKIGLTCDAVWTDYDNDGWQDLILVGEWMPIRILHNNKGSFTDVSQAAGTLGKVGWWTSIVPGDFDNDGKMDYIVGNLGLNSFYRASSKYPVSIYGKDFDNNGSYDAIPTIYLKASQEDTSIHEYPVHTKDDITKQLVSFRKKFPTYKSYATATFDQMFSPEDLNGALVLRANYFSNSILRNKGNGKFDVIPLQNTAQFSCLNGMLAEDIDGDGKLDVLATGNDYGTEPSVGRYDACNGILMKGDGKGSFTNLSILQSGWYVPGNGKALVKLKNPKGNMLIAVIENRGPLRIFKLNNSSKTLSVNNTDVSAIIKYKDGSMEKRELNYGSSFLSQSSRFITINDHIASIEITDNKGNKRTVNF